MSAPEHSPQTPIEKKLSKLSPIDRLVSERDSVGSTREYLSTLAIYYNSVDQHRPNMLQLQRIARFVTDPNNKGEQQPKQTDAFYWGEILGYTACDRLIGDQWPTMSYKLLNDTTRTSIASLFEEDLPVSENLDIASMLITAELEQLDGTKIPPMYDELIEQWAQEISQDEFEQHHIILGFRHVIRQVVEIATAETHIEHEFLQIMDKNEIDDKNAYEIDHIADLRDVIMDSFADHYIAFGDINTDDDDKYAEAVDYLTYGVNRDFVKYEKLGYDDDIIISGDVKCILISDDPDVENQACHFGDDVVIEGSVGPLSVCETPSVAGFEILKKGPEEGDDIDTDLFGVVMFIENPVLVDSQAKHTIPPFGDRTLAVILSHPNVHFLKRS